MIKEDQNGLKNSELVQKEATYLSVLFVRKSTELRAKLRELLEIKVELKSDKQSSSNLEALFNLEYEKLVRERLQFVFEGAETYNFSPHELESMTATIQIITKGAKRRNLAREKIKEAKAELATLQGTRSLTDSDQIYKKKLSQEIALTKRMIKSHSLIQETDLQIIENARRKTEEKLKQLEGVRRETDEASKESFWKNEGHRHEGAMNKHHQIDGKIARLLAKRANGFEDQLENFAATYSVKNGVPPVTYWVLQKATHDLDQGQWKPGNTYETAEAQLQLNSQIEAQVAYCDFIEAQKRLPKVPTLNGSQNDDLKKENDDSVDTLDGVSNEKSKETFMKNYVCLPSSPDLDTFDKMDQCLICFEPVNYDFKALSEFCDVTPEHDQLLQVPGDNEAHRLTSCGHLIHKACLKGLQINRGLAIYKCPKCPKLIPYHELDSKMRIQKHQFCLDSI